MKSTLGDAIFARCFKRDRSCALVYPISHLCGRRHCVRREHIILEEPGANRRRKSCHRRTRTCACRPRCLQNPSRRFQPDEPDEPDEPGGLPRNPAATRVWMFGSPRRPREGRRRRRSPGRRPMPRCRYRRHHLIPLKRRRPLRYQASDEGNGVERPECSRTLRRVSLQPICLMRHIRLGSCLHLRRKRQGGWCRFVTSQALACRPVWWAKG